MQISDVRIDKLGHAHYMRNFEEFMGDKRLDALKILELGVAKGDSLRHWAEWLPNARIVGVDINPPPDNVASQRISIYQGEQQDKALLDRIGSEQAPDGFDLIVDDASHLGQYSRISFWHLFTHHLKPGGLYFVEDWGTGYWPDYPDGDRYKPRAVDFSTREKFFNSMEKRTLVRNNYVLRKLVGWSRWHLVQRKFPSHQNGMVGFIKELVDECGIQDATNETFGIGGNRSSRIEWMRVSIGHVIVKKPAA